MGLVPLTRVARDARNPSLYGKNPFGVRAAPINQDPPCTQKIAFFEREGKWNLPEE